MTIEPNALLQRATDALNETRSVFASYDGKRIAEMKKDGGDPVTAVDLEIDHLLRERLQRPGEGWLSEETADSTERLHCEVVWIVDPLDGTREFIEGLPEFCVSVAAVVAGRPVAGGVLNPAADLLITGALGLGVECNGQASQPLQPAEGETIRVLASRSEWKRGEWSVVESAGFQVVPMGSVAYKMARVAAGLDHITWTPVPKHEWDVAGGAALLSSAGGQTVDASGAPIAFNQPRPWLPLAIALPQGRDPVLGQIRRLIEKQVASE